ncbi:ubiquitin-activating emzyme E1 [Neoconidiobolus thromboides FSU 785]|nr:ubiquitin-activating emzyme E1 [Neoconidiobolus thromboides FSU 785]
MNTADLLNEDIDLDYYSRQIYVYGLEGQKKLATNKVLIFGLNGLGLEVAKNLILSGVGSVSIFDDKRVTIDDLSSQYFLTEDDIGKFRAQCSIDKLKQLNSRVRVNLLDKEPENKDLEDYQSIVLSEVTLDKQIYFNEHCRVHNIQFINVDVHGLFGQLFIDFGPEFITHDKDGEPLEKGLIENISKGDDGIVLCLEENRHNLTDDDLVQIRDVQGMIELNDISSLKIKVHSPFEFSIGSTNSYSDYISGGSFIQIKQATKVEFKSLKQNLKEPNLLINEDYLKEKYINLHIAFYGLNCFIQSHLEVKDDIKGLEDYLSICIKFKEENFNEIKLNYDLLNKVFHQSQLNLMPMAALFGGLAAQEVIKGLICKFTPINQLFYFDSIHELIDDNNNNSNENDTEDTNIEEESENRYSSQIKLLGKEIQSKLNKENVFLVGMGAIGNEILKNLIMMGVGSEGQLHITDSDIIEKSNLNRQLLTQEKDINFNKSIIACQSVLNINQNYQGHLKAYNLKLDNNLMSEMEFNDSFYSKLNTVFSNLDNMKTRRFLDNKCINHLLPMLDSATLGNKGSTQLILPNLSESFSYSSDPISKSIPMCTLKHFPYQIEHTIQWAKDLYKEKYQQNINYCRGYLKDEKYIMKMKSKKNISKQMIMVLNEYLNTFLPKNYLDCIKWARFLFEDLFVNQIKQLLFNFPMDALSSDNKSKFWSPPKKCPTPLHFTIHNDLHINFIIDTAQLFAHTFKIKVTKDEDQIIQYLKTIQLPEFIPDENKAIQINDNEPINETTNEQELTQLIQQLPNNKHLTEVKPIVSQFSLDRINLAINFITSASNLRALNYGINILDKYQTIEIASDVLPATITTTTISAALSCLEYLKLISNNKKENYRNYYFNTNLSLFTYSQPKSPMEFKYLNTTFTEWDRFEMKDMKLNDFLVEFQNQHKIVLTMITSGSSSLYMKHSKKEDRLEMSLKKIYELVTKKTISDKVKYLTLQIMGMSEEEEYLDELPAVRLEI